MSSLGPIVSHYFSIVIFFVSISRHRPSEKVMQLNLLAVRRRCRKSGVGKFLIEVSSIWEKFAVRNHDKNEIIIIQSKFRICPSLFSFDIRELKQLTTTATATKTPQNKRLNEQKQSFCTCVLNFGPFLCRPVQSSNVK